MQKTKHVINLGWELAEYKMLNKLEQYAKEGWMLVSMNHLFFKLVKSKTKSKQLLSALLPSAAKTPRGHE